MSLTFSIPTLVLFVPLLVVSLWGWYLLLRWLIFDPLDRLIQRRIRERVEAKKALIRARDAEDWGSR